MVQWQQRQILTLVLMTAVWGCNWPLMKWGIADYPGMMFRCMSIGIGLPVLGVVLWRWRIPFKVARAEWGELLHLSIPNMFIWYGFMMLALPHLNSGRAAILGYTMPIFSAVFGYIWFGAQMGPRAWLGEVLHWQDLAAVCLIVGAIASVLWPSPAQPPETEPSAEPVPTPEQDASTGRSA